MKEVIEKVQDILGSEKPVVCKNETRKNELNDVVADITHVREVLGWRPAHSLEQGLQEMIEKMTVLS